MAENARIRINLSQREIEIAGDPDFVERHLDRLEDLLGNAQAMPVSEPTKIEPPAELGSFGEFMHRLPSAATEVDKMLAAGYYCQSSSSEGSFTTAEANRRLVEHGVKVGNASQCVKQSLTARRVFAMSKGQYKVSVEGKSYLDKLMISPA